MHEAGPFFDRETLISLVMSMKALDLRLSACELLLGQIQLEFPDSNALHRVEEFRKRKELLEKMDEKYDHRLKKLLASTDAVLSAQDVQEFLRKANERTRPT